MSTIIRSVMQPLPGFRSQEVASFLAQILAVGGGVSANRTLRAALEVMAKKEGVELFIPTLDLCTDNAAMAAVAVEKWRANLFAPLDLDAVPTYQGKN